MGTLKENIHTAPSFSFAHYCEQVAKSRREHYFRENFEPTSRLGVFGDHNGCVGNCEGTGWVPVFRDEMTDPMRSLWVQAELDQPSSDGWHLLPCPKCRPCEELDEHIVKTGDSYELKSKKTGKNLGKYSSKTGAEKRERQVEYFKHLKEDTEDEKDTSDDHPKTEAEKKEEAKDKRREKQRDREKKKLLPYEFDKQKDADKAGKHLGLHSSHLSGSGIYKPGTSDQDLRDAVSRKKEKQKMRSGKGLHENVRGLLNQVKLKLSD